MKSNPKDIKVVFPDLNKIVNELVANRPITFKIDGEALTKFNKWNDKHKKVCKESKSTIGGRLSYMFTPNGLCTEIIIQCICGEQIDLTEEIN